MSRHAADIHREDAAWLAGLLDGEGCFDSTRGNPRIRVKMADLDVVLRAADIMDATTYGEDRSWPGVERKPLLTAQVTGDRALAVMRAVLPWLGSRRSARVTEIITEHAVRKNGRIRLIRTGTGSKAA